MEEDGKFMEKLQNSRKAQTKLCCVVFICFIFMIIECVGGYISNSIAIMTDAAHMFSDVTGFGISIIAIRFGLRSPDKRHSYGYHRAEVLGALTSMVIIWVLVLWLVIEAINRVYLILYKGGYDMDPEIMVATAIFGLCCNIVNLIALGECSCKADKDDSYDATQAGDALVQGINSESVLSSAVGDDSDANENLNVRAAMIHMMGDLIQSIGVIIAGLIIYYYPEWKILDPILTFMFSIIVFTTTIGITKDCYAILMELTPDGVKCDRIQQKIENIPEVDYIDDFHCWALAGGKNVITAHIYLKRSADSEGKTPSSNDIHRVYQEAQQILQRYDVCHSTLQIL